MARIGTRSLLLAIDGTDRTDEVSTALITSTTKSTTRALADGQVGEMQIREYRLEVTTPQDPAGLWGFVWANAGTLQDFYLAPEGNATATASQPHWSGVLSLTEPEGNFLGGAADASRRRILTASMSWLILGRPTMHDSGAYPGLIPAGW
jgi:hypothetical protein